MKFFIDTAEVAEIKAASELGVLTASRPESVGGAQLPMLVHTLASAYLM